MTQTNPTLRLATTAIAAALAISSTPLLAQETPTPAPTTGTPVPSPADPLAPAPVTDTNATPETTATPAPATTKRTATTRPKATATRTASSRPAASHPAARTAPARTATAAPKAAPEAAPAPVPAETATAAPPPPPAAAPIATPPAERGIDMNQTLPLVGAGAVGLLALAGAGLALRRRKRRREEELADEQWDEWMADEPAPAMAEPEPVIVSEPPREPALATAAAATTAAAVAPRHDAVDENAPVTDLPEGFDISRFGPHVQAAYRGPTPDNPSLSLKYRLRKAAALDQRERLERESRIEPVAEQPAAGQQNGFIISRNTSAARPAQTQRTDAPA
jgi:hypothetical protein